jgi:hypothetical protein
MPNRWRAPQSAVSSSQSCELDATQGTASPKVRPVLATTLGNSTAHQANAVAMATAEKMGDG